MRKSFMLTVAAASLLTAASSALAAGIWVPANVPFGGSNFTIFDINDKNAVTGSYSNASGMEIGVFGPFDGSNYQTIDDQPRGLNDKGWITGFDTGTLQQWERSPAGKLKYITYRGEPVDVALVMGINKPGIFVGDYSNSSGVEVLAIGQKYKYTAKIRCPIKNTGCAGRGIDTAEDVDGWYYDSSGIQHGFAIVGGTTIKIDYPNAFYTVVEGLNDNGKATGQWEDVSGVIHGFVYDISKKLFTSLDAPGASFTQVWGINNHDVIAVSAAESSGTESFAYCMHRTGCPSAGAAVVRTNQRSPGRSVPQAN